MKNVVNVKAKLSSKNQLTIPKAVRDSLGLTDQDKVIFQLSDGTVTLKKDTDFWHEVNQQAQVYGNLDTNELAWGNDQGDEVIPE